LPQPTISLASQLPIAQVLTSFAVIIRDATMIFVATPSISFSSQFTFSSITENPNDFSLLHRTQLERMLPWRNRIL